MNALSIPRVAFRMQMWRPPTPYERVAMVSLGLHAWTIFCMVASFAVAPSPFQMLFTLLMVSMIYRSFSAALAVVRHYMATRHDSETKPLHQIGVGVPWVYADGAVSAIWTVNLLVHAL